MFTLLYSGRPFQELSKSGFGSAKQLFFGRETEKRKGALKFFPPL